MEVGVGWGGGSEKMEEGKGDVKYAEAERFR